MNKQQGSHSKSDFMNENLSFKTRLYFTGIVIIAIWSLLTWNHYHGGVPIHHILQRNDLPAISNWWGGILLPLLTWFLLYRIHKRLIYSNDEKLKISKSSVHIRYRFIGALFFGVLLSAFFSFGYPDICGYMVVGLFPIALFFPIYRAECILGFVIGMTFTFGAVLPTGVGSILALVGAVIYLYIRSAIVYLVSKLVKIVSSHKNNATDR